MSSGLVTDHLRALIAKQVDDHCLVVWYDPEGYFREIAGELGIPETTFVRHDGSFFALRRAIDPLMEGLDPPRLLVYVPMDPADARHALVELETAGVVMKPGQQPPARNTKLAVVARNALKPLLGEESAAAIEKQVDQGKLSLAELDAVGGDVGGYTQGVVSLLFKSSNPQDIALAFLGSDRLDAEVAKKSAAAELVGILGDAFGVVLPRDEPLPALRVRFARHVLATDLIAGLGESVPAALTSVKVAAKPSAREACSTLARTWRMRRDARESYVAASLRVEGELGLPQFDFPEAIGEVETFRAVERALLRRVEGALADGASEDLLRLAEARKSRFWSEATPALQAHWSLVAAAAEVLLETDRVALETKGKTADALALVRSYTEGDRPWCLLDTHFRHMESRWHNFEPEPGERHEALERLVQKATGRYMEVGSALAEHFLRRYRKAKLPLEGVARQVETYETLVKPSLAGGRTAYLWVDALRYEMARELCGVLADEFEVSLHAAIGTVPTITEIGMAALLPGAHESARVVAVGGGKLALEVGGVAIRDRKDRVEFLRTRAGVPFFDAKLDDLLPKPGKKVRDGIRDARLVLITSQEIDELCERDNLTQARRQMDGVLNDLRRGVRVLGELGVRTIVLAADHGHLFGDEVGGDMKIDAPGGETADLHRRVWVGRGGTSEPSYVRASLGEFGGEGDLDLATPWGFACFKAKGGARAYFHGGLSLQELVVPVATLLPKETGTGEATGTIDWKLTPGSAKISTRFFSVQVVGKSSGLFEFVPPKVRVEVRAKGKCLSQPVSGSYGYEDATGDLQLKVAEDDPKATATNTVTLMIVEETSQKTVGVHLLDAATGRELAVLEKVEVAIAF